MNLIRLEDVAKEDLNNWVDIVIIRHSNIDLIEEIAKSYNNLLYFGKSTQHLHNKLYA